MIRYKIVLPNPVVFTRVRDDLRSRGFNMVENQERGLLSVQGEPPEDVITDIQASGGSVAIEGRDETDAVYRPTIDQLETILAQGGQPKVVSLPDGQVTTTGVIDFATFQKVELRTGTVTKAGWVPKSDKLLNLEINFGPHGTRTILAGIAKDYPSESLIGQNVIAVFNLAPRKMMGIMSHGMLLAARSESGAVVLASCPGVPDGSLLG